MIREILFRSIVGKGLFVCCDDRRSLVSVFLSVLIPFDVSKVSGLMGLGRLFCARVGERNFRFERM